MYHSLVNISQVNTTEDEQSKLATDYSPNDIAFFKKAVNIHVHSRNILGILLLDYKLH